jgi:hypothetical protein
MADKVSPAGKSVVIELVVPDPMPVTYADYCSVIGVPESIYLTFFQLQPPHNQEVLDQQGWKVRAHPTVRLALAPDHARQLMLALQATFEEREAGGKS